MKERRGGTGEDRKGQVFQLSLQHLSDPSDSDCALSTKRNKNITYCTYLLCSVSSYGFRFLCVLSSPSTYFFLIADREAAGANLTFL